MENIGSLFDSISNKYDAFNHLTSFGIDYCWRRQAVKSLSKCDNVLDVAVGTGDFSIEILRQHKAQHINGIDLSEGMLAVGKRKLERKNLISKVDLLKCNCAQLPFNDATFDAITCGYGVRNFDQLEQCLREMYRVLKPEGELIILEFGYPKNPFIRAIYNFYFSYCMPVIGRMMTKDKDAFRYFMASVKGFYKGQALVDKLSEAGFVKGEYKYQTFGISILYKASK